VPYLASQATKTVTSAAIAKWTLTLDPLPSYLVAGDGAYFSGRLMRDAVGAAGETVKIQYCLYDKPHICYDIASVTTDSQGYFAYDWDIPYTMGCKRYLFLAVHPASGASSAMQDRPVAFRTRISISAPDKVSAGTPFTVSGKLEYESDRGTYSPLAGKTVSIYYDTTKLADVTTAGDGSYSATVSIGTTGVFTLKAVYAGEGLFLTSFGTISIPVVGGIPGYVLTIAGVAGVLAVVAAPIVITEWRKKARG